MAISIITRANKTSELKALIRNLNSNNEVEREIIAVCNVNDYDINGINLVIENSNRFQAKITGIINESHENVLLIDSDQIPEKGLLRELENKKEDMVIIPEKSLNTNFTSICLDDWRSRNEKLARKILTPYVPVVPRFYKQKYLKNIAKKISPNVCKIDHEDSILYYYIYKETKNIGFSHKCIYNNDPNLYELMKKAYLYGKNNKRTENFEIPEEISILLNRLNNNIFNIKELGIGKGYILQILRAMSYELGRII
jgi:hypothetical protein